MPTKFLVLGRGGGCWGFSGRGGVEVPILFLWARGFFWNKAESFAGKDSLEEFAEKFAGNFPTIRQAKIENSTQIRRA